MKKVVFHISEKLLAQIEEAMDCWGFVNKPEFFRYSAIEFLRSDARLMPADETLQEHAKAIRSVKAHKAIREDRMAWYKRASEAESELKAHRFR